MVTLIDEHNNLIFSSSDLFGLFDLILLNFPIIGIFNLLFNSENQTIIINNQQYHWIYKEVPRVQ